jgi:DNA-directed RNA polymerase specialized sigma24 family protein
MQIVDQTLIEDIKKRMPYIGSQDDFEDAVQEALIRAWELSDSVLDKNKILYKAVDRGKAVVSKGTGSAPLGKPLRDKTGQRHSTGDLSRQKIKDFQVQFKDIHDRLPTVTEISRGLGMSTRNVRDHLLRSSTDRKSIATDKGRIIEAMQLSSVEIDPDYMGETYEFEDELVSYLTFIEMISVLNERDRELMYLCHVQGMKNAEVARWVKKSDSTVRELISRAHLSLRNHILAVQPL